MSEIPLYATFDLDCWLITREPAPDVWAALSDRLYIGTSFGRERPTDWFGQPVMDSRTVRT